MDMELLPVRNSGHLKHLLFNQFNRSSTIFGSFIPTDFHGRKMSQVRLSRDFALPMGGSEGAGAAERVLSCSMKVSMCFNRYADKAGINNYVSFPKRFRSICPMQKWLENVGKESREKESYHMSIGQSGPCLRSLYNHGLGTAKIRSNQCMSCDSATSCSEPAGSLFACDPYWVTIYTSCPARPETHGDT